jgi:hypothetical protein
MLSFCISIACRAVTPTASLPVVSLPYCCNHPPLPMRFHWLQVQVQPIYLASNGNGSDAIGSPTPEQALEQAIFHQEHGLRSVLGCDPRDAVVLMSGVPGDVAAHLTRKFTHAGVAGDKILYCDYM